MIAPERRPASQNPIVTSLLGTDRVSLLRPTAANPTDRDITIPYAAFLDLLAAFFSSGIKPPQAVRTADYTALNTDAWALMPFDLSSAVADVILTVPAASDAGGLGFMPLRVDDNAAVKLLVQSLGGSGEINFGNELAVLGTNERQYIQSNGTIYLPY